VKLRHGAKGFGTSQKLAGIIVPGMDLLLATGPALGQLDLDTANTIARKTP